MRMEEWGHEEGVQGLLEACTSESKSCTVCIRLSPKWLSFPIKSRSRQGQVRPTPEEIQRLMDLPATSDLGDFAAFSGGPPPGSGANMGSVPSRLLMQQLYDAGVNGLQIMHSDDPQSPCFESFIFYVFRDVGCPAGGCPRDATPSWATQGPLGNAHVPGLGSEGPQDGFRCCLPVPCLQV